MHDRYLNYFDKPNRYETLFRILKLKHIVSVDGNSDVPESVCLTIMKGNYCESRTWSFTMLDSLDDDTLAYVIDAEVIRLITTICERILDETKLQKN